METTEGTPKTEGLIRKNMGLILKYAEYWGSVGDEGH